MLHFQYIEYLIALAAIPVILLLYYLLIRWKKKATKKIGDPILVKQLTVNFSSKKFNLKFILYVLAFAFCAIAVAGLVIPDGTQKINRKGIDIMFALDVSKSMLAQDIKPNRLERAKQVITNIINSSPDDRIGLVVFAGRAYLQMPMTIDHAAAKMYLSSASPDDIPTQGTVISDALKMSSAAFNPKDKTYKTVVLLSDGEDHDKDAIKVVKQLRDNGITVNTIGIGSPQGAPIMDPETNTYKTDDKGNMVISKLNEEELSNIAKTGNGIYQHYSSTDEVTSNIKNKLASMGETVISDKSFDSFRQFFQYFLALAFLLLVIENFISEKKKMYKKITATGFALWFMCFSSFAQDAKNEIIKGNEAYKNNDFDKAEVFYAQAQKADEKNTTASYNLGNTLYRKENAEEAVNSFDNTIKNTTDNAIKQKAFYNKGVAYQKANKLPECILAYKNALLLNPNDEDARQNLERALKEQKKQENKKDKKDSKDQKKNKDNKQDQDKKDQQKKDSEPKPQPSKISKQDAEEKLKSLLEKEKALQDKLHKIKGAEGVNSPDKDW
ncbi:MAG: VWA domain-containing protein [Bacteroidota bacterium]|nr:VWA domain-containing protein [Bacteroidota bacterium]MDQ6890213.1 VWA domain-containing protein [Bacteroidota bacterium]